MAYTLYQRLKKSNLGRIVLNQQNAQRQSASDASQTIISGIP